jgi:hypothetical protein
MVAAKFVGLAFVSVSPVRSWFRVAAAGAKLRVW